jgi:hypothetical protein
MDGTEYGGVISLFEFLPVNTTLISLNLANNSMEASCGEMFLQLLM